MSTKDRTLGRATRHSRLKRTTFERRRWRTRRVALVAAVTSATLLLQACTVPDQRLRYGFDAVNNPVSSVVDDSGKGHTASVASNGAPGASVAAITPGHDGTGKAVSFPAVCPNTGATCPRVVITSPDAPDLNPGTANFSFGLWVRLTRSDLTSDHGSNLVQKGIHNTPQWKAQIDDPINGRPSCVLSPDADPSTSVMVIASVGVADGSWHKITCQRADGVLRILVDNVAVGSKALPGTFSVTPTGRALSVGGQSAVLRNDQYHGDLDEVYFNLD